MTISRGKLFKDAWAYAKAFARFGGRSPRSLFPDALRKCWAEAKALASRASRPAPAHVSDAFWANSARSIPATRHKARLGSFCAHAW